MAATLWMLRPAIAVVELTGVLGPYGRTRAYAQLLEGLERNRRFKSVVLHVDSPGGTVGASEFLHASLSRLAEKKPVVAFIRGMGASGAYMLCCAATRIVALPSALVGSIGVISVRPVLQGLMQRLGVGVSVYKGGHLKDMGGFWRSPSPEEQSRYQGLVQEVYDSFVTTVARGRHIAQERVSEYATGEFYTGKRAREFGLVDEVGDAARAMDLAAELGRVARRPVWVRPRRSLVERMLGRFDTPALEEFAAEAERLLWGGLYYMAPLR